VTGLSDNSPTHPQRFVSAMSKVLTLTMNPTLEVSTTIDKVVHTDKLRCTAAKTQPGGGGINVARVLSRLNQALLNCAQQSIPWAA